LIANHKKTSLAPKSIRQCALIGMLIFLLSSVGFCVGKEFASYNLNINNGLPSNHVYSTITDRFGYLWIATDKGIVCYNGYNLKVFDLSCGLSNMDTWRLIEDKSDRIWLCNISDAVGYIRNGQYHEAYLKDTQLYFYPRYILPYGKGIAFLSNKKRDDLFESLCIAQSDTVHTYTINQFPGGRCTINENGELVVIARDTIWQLSLGTFLTNYHFKKLCPLNPDFLKPSGGYLLTMSGYLFYYDIKGGGLNVLNITTKKYSVLKFDSNGQNDKIILVYTINSTLYVVGEKNIYILNNALKLVNTIAIETLTNVKLTNGNNATYMQTNDLWGTLVASYSGLFINYVGNHKFKKVASLNLDNYVHKGHAGDGTDYWWNNQNSTLMALKDTTVVYKKKIRLPEIRKIVPYNNVQSIILAHSNLYYINNATGAISGFCNNNFKLYFVADAVVKDSSDYYLLTDQVFCLSHIRVRNGDISEKRFNNDKYNFRYTNITYDSLRGHLWMYFAKKILISTTNKDILISKEMLSTLGIKNIENITIDNKYGNIFIKDIDKLYLFDPGNMSFRTLFSNYNLANARIRIDDGSLVIAGSFGVLFSRIVGVGQLSKPMLYNNTKHLLYNYIEDLQLTGGNLLLKTDNGLYHALIPTDSCFSDSATPASVKYKFIVAYNDSVHNINSQDTVRLDQRHLKLAFDIINPTGTGRLQFQYSLPDEDGNWYELNGNELLLPTLQSGYYYNLSIKARDNAWQSNVMKVHLYVIPKWWQTVSGKRIIFITAGLVFILLLLLVIVVTRNIVNRKNILKYERIQLELKSVYAQINPHFIFNTLNLALLFIEKRKMEEAYRHVSKFSKLLRAYMKSARNKFISIKEEVINLEQYIELQQARFENRFEYRIDIDNKIDILLTKIPSLLLQPFVENAINHGLLYKEDIGHLTITFQKDEQKNKIICKIEDDGIGREEAAIIKEQEAIPRQSYGNELVTDLISMFNRYEKINIQLSYIDKQYPETGTIVIITITYE
jgi:hypothetical protein